MANTFPPAPGVTSNPLGSGSLGSGGFGGLNPPVGGTPGKANKNQIVTSLYKTILGRDPDPNALMYYISQPEINEDAIRKQMVESDEHKAILDDYKNIANLKKEIEDAKSQIQIKDKQMEDKQTEIDQMNTILQQKNQELTRMREEVAASQKPKVVVAQPVASTSSSVNLPSQDMGFKKFIKDLIKKVFFID